MKMFQTQAVDLNNTSCRPIHLFTISYDKPFFLENLQVRFELHVK
jgi:hypothetical protein